MDKRDMRGQDTDTLSLGFFLLFSSSWILLHEEKEKLYRLLFPSKSQVLVSLRNDTFFPCDFLASLHFLLPFLSCVRQRGKREGRQGVPVMMMRRTKTPENLFEGKKRRKMRSRLLH